MLLNFVENRREQVMATYYKDFEDTVVACFRGNCSIIRILALRILPHELAHRFRRNDRKCVWLIIILVSLLAWLVLKQSDTLNVELNHLGSLDFTEVDNRREEEEPFAPTGIVLDATKLLHKINTSKIFYNVLLDGIAQKNRIGALRPKNKLQNTMNVLAACKNFLVVDRGVKQDAKVRGNSYTVVTGYFNLGTFQKGADHLNQSYSTKMYFKWMAGYKFVLNDVIMFTDDPYLFREFLRIRNYHYHMRSALCLVERYVLWPFQLLPIIEAVHKQRNYPIFYPDTAISEYGAVMHAKYALMEIALDWNPFSSDYFAWVDLGTFRELASNFSHLPWLQNISSDGLKQSFYLAVPKAHERSCIAMNQIEVGDFNSSILQIFRNNRYWVGGGYFLALKDVMHRWIEQYIRAVLVLLEIGFSNTDQQTIYAMFHPEMLNDRRMHPNVSAIVPIQAFRKQYHDSVNEWFYLPYRTRNEWFMFVRNNMKCNRTTMLLDCSDVKRKEDETSKILVKILIVIRKFISSCLNII